MSSTAPAGGLSRYELWYGRAQEPVERKRLGAGNLTVVLEGADVRAVRLGDDELLRGVYMAVRDEDWGTVLGTLSGYEITQGPDSFAVEFEMTHRAEALLFTWKGRIEGGGAGVVSYELDGVAESDFRYCRIGFCLLHPPAQSAGQPYRGRTPKGPVEGTLPLDIGPQVFERGLYWPLFSSVSELELTLSSGIELELVFEGDLFEMEDQRNWTDGSFKTYCTPQELGYPFDAQAGERFHQKVTLRVACKPGGAGEPTGARPAGARSVKPAGAHRVEVDAGQRRPLPPIGFALPRDIDQQSESEIALLEAARPNHLRVDLVTSSDGWPRRLSGAQRTAAALDCPLEVAAFAQDAAELEPLVDRLTDGPVCRLLMFAYGQEMSDPAMTRRARELRTARGLTFGVIGGTDLWFAELNRDHPDVAAMDGLVYSINPQVHTFDEESIAQSLEAQPETIKTANVFAGGLPLSVSTITLRPRDAVHVDHFNPTEVTGSLPFSVDPRQPSLFAAAWTVGSIAALAGAGAASLTYYETAGWRGIIAGDRPLPTSFPGPPPGGVYAMYHVFADVLEPRAGATLVGATSDSPAQVAALAVSSNNRLRVLIANLTPTPVIVDVGGLLGSTVSAWTLDESTANEALSEPLVYRSRAGTELAVTRGTATLDLAPFAVARLVASPAL